MYRLSADRTGRPHIDREMSYRNSGIPKPARSTRAPGRRRRSRPAAWARSQTTPTRWTRSCTAPRTRLRHHQHRVVCQVPGVRQDRKPQRELTDRLRPLTERREQLRLPGPVRPPHRCDHTAGASRGWTSKSTSTAAGWCGQTTPRAPPAWVPKLSTTTSPGSRARGFRIWREAVTASAPRRQSGVAAPGQTRQQSPFRRDDDCVDRDQTVCFRVACCPSP